MFIFGGYTGDLNSNTNLTNRNDLWEYRFTSHQWSERRFAPDDEKPVARSAHGAAVHQGHLYIFAGYDGNARLNDMWRVRLTATGGQQSGGGRWEKISYTGESPPTCCNFATAVVGDALFVFSGQSGARTSNALYRYDFLLRTWSRLGAEHILRCAAPPPHRRYGHTMVAFDRFLFVFGGTAENNLSNDLHRYDLLSQEWYVECHY